MDLRLVSKLLGVVALLIGGVMVFSLPWASPALGYRRGLPTPETFETRGFWALSLSIVLCGLVGGLLTRLGRNSGGRLYRKEAMAAVGLSWMLATVLGALPYWFAGVYRGPSVRLFGPGEKPYVFNFGPLDWRQQWREASVVDRPLYRVIDQLRNKGAEGVSEDELIKESGVPDARRRLEDLVAHDPIWRKAILFPGDGRGWAGRTDTIRIRWIKMNLIDSLFEAQSGFSTTGATVISELEDPALAPHCILFWRSSTHFLGGLGIIVLFVVILGQGSAGKALVRAEMPGPTKEGHQARMQHTAWLFAGIYFALNCALALILWAFPDISLFDALCHSFGCMATGGFSTYNDSVGHFNAAAVEYTIIVFMILAGTNFTLLYYLLVRKPGKMLADVEWQTYMGVIGVVTLLVMCFGLWCGDFSQPSSPPGPGGSNESPQFEARQSGDAGGPPQAAGLPPRGGPGTMQPYADALRFGLFQVVSIVTTTGYGTHDFDKWNSFARGSLFLLMFVGGCAGSTGGGMKVIRHILFIKILRLEIEQSYRPSVVRPLRLGGKPVDDPNLRQNILVYFGLILLIFVFSWMYVVTIEPDATWGAATEHKLIDSASGVAATLNNIGPGLGTVGATQNYGHFSPSTKALFVLLMMLGRLEIFAIAVLFSINFWRQR